MVLFNYSTKELTAKVVYYGPGLCGKTTNLQFVHQNLPDSVRGKMLSLATKTDRTLFFDFLPIDLGEIRGMKTRVQLYTVPGQVFYNETRKLVLKGADGIVFVADSQKQMLKANSESFKNLEENLKAHGMTLAEMPHVIQFNKRDLPKLSGIEEINAEVNKYNAPFYESVATTGIGVQDTLKGITKLVLLHLTKKYEAKPSASVVAEARRPDAPAPAVSIPTPDVPVQPPAIPIADAGPPATPLAAPAAAAIAPHPGAPMACAPAVDPGPGLSLPDSEIEDLVNEVEEISAAAEEPIPAAPIEPMASTASPVPQGMADPSFEIDRAADPEWPAVTPYPAVAVEHTPLAPPTEDLMPAAEPVDLGADPSPTNMAGASVTLTDAVEDRELFEDPDLSVASLRGGDEREIVVPVEIRGTGAEVRRFALSIRLRLDPVDE